MSHKAEFKVIVVLMEVFGRKNFIVVIVPFTVLVKICPVAAEILLVLGLCGGCSLTINRTVTTIPRMVTLFHLIVI